MSSPKQLASTGQGNFTSLPVGEAIRDREEALRGFRLDLEVAGRSAHTVQLYMYGVGRFLGFLDSIGLQAPLAGISAEHLKHWLSAEQQAGTSPGSRDAYLKGVRQFFKYLVESGEVRENPAVKVPRPKVPVKVVETLTTDEVTRLLRSVGGDRTILGLRDSAIILMLLDAGLRASELLGLTVEDVDFTQRTALVHGKGARDRVVAFGARTLQALHRYMRKARITEGLIFRGRTGAPLDPMGLHQMLKRRGRVVGLERLHAHLFRHTAATWARRAGLDEQDLKTLFGWSPSSTMVQRYTAAAQQQEALERHKRAGVLDRLLS